MNKKILTLLILLRGSLLELWRRQDMWILVMLMGLFGLVALGARFTGSHSPAAATFMLDLGYQLAGIFAHFLTVILAVRQIPNEIENRTLYPLLAKPLDRDTLLMGKWLACVLGGLLVYSLFVVIVELVTPRMETYVFATLLQHLAVQPLSIAWAAGLGILLSLCLPRGLALGGSLLLVFASETLFNWLRDSISLVHALPRFGALNLATRYTDGAGALTAAEFLFLVVYPLLWTLFCLGTARELFRRRAL
ncbi:MAG: ABC transporter permease [Kiritimatiellia bacterium]